MEYTYHDFPFPHVTIKNYYDEDELKKIWLELDFLTNSNKMSSANATGSAVSPETHELLKQNHGIFLDTLYADRNISNILSLTRKHFDPDLMTNLSREHYLFRYMLYSTKDTTLLSYYEDSDHYLPHFDRSSMTALLWLYKEPKSFDGGDFTLTDFNYEIPLQNNFMVIFPSILFHSVSPVKMKTNADRFSGLGRYVITNFMLMI